MDSKTEVTIDAAAKNNLAAAQFAETNAKLINAGLEGGNVSEFLAKDRPDFGSIEIPLTINRIGSYGMYGYTNVRFISIPDNIKEIGYCGFGECSSLSELSIRGHIDRIHGYAFEGNRLTRIYINSVDVLESDALTDGGGDSTGESITLEIDDLGRMEDCYAQYLYAGSVYGHIGIRAGGYLGSNCLPASVYDGQTTLIEFSISVGDGATISNMAFSNINPGSESAITFENLSIDRVKAYPNYPFGMASGLWFIDKDGNGWEV